MTAIELIKQHEDYDIGYTKKCSFIAGYVTAKYETQINDFYTKAPDANLRVDENGIRLTGCSREVLNTFLLCFGGSWSKDINTWQSDKMDYFREEKTEAFTYELKVEAVAPPPSCQIVEEEVDVPARKEIRKKIVCKEESEQNATTATNSPS